MSVRFYLPSAAVPSDGITPGFAAWSQTADGLRRALQDVKDGSTMVSTSTFGNSSPTANQSALWRQFISRPMAAGNAFSTSDTVRGVVQANENGADDNVNRQPICLKVCSLDGSTVQSTLLPLGHYGPSTSEWVVGTSTNRQLANGDALQADYTTVAGDRLVLEVGAQVNAAGGTNVFASLTSGSADGSDLSENEVDTGLGNPWFEISRDIAFQAPDDQQDGCLLMILQRWDVGIPCF